MDQERKATLALMYQWWIDAVYHRCNRDVPVRSPELYETWASRLILGGEWERNGHHFRRFCRIWLEAQVYELPLSEVAKDYHEGRRGPDPEDWPELKYEEGLDA